LSDKLTVLFKPHHARQYDEISVGCCHSVMKKNPRIYLEKNPENKF